MASGGGQYMRSAPLRRLRHPLDESPVWSLLGSALGALVALLVGLPVLLVLAVLLPVTLAARWFLLLLYWNRRRPLISADIGGGAESMRGNDCRWLGAAWRCSVLHAVLVFDGRVELSTLQQLLLSRVLPAYPRLTHRLHKLPLTAGAGHCWLPDPHFDIDKHVFHGPCLPTDLQLQTYVSELLSEGLLTDKSPWELQVLQAGGRQGTTTIILRVHQSVADGPALVTMLCRCLADTKVIPRIPSRSEQPMGFYCKVLRSCLFGPLTVFLWLLMSARDYNLLTQRATWSGQMSVSWSASITLAKVTRVKQVTRSTVNCVLLSALAGALRVLLQSCGVRQPPDLRVVLPVDLRTSADCSDTRLGSQMAPVVVSLPVGVEGAVPRLWSTRRALRALRQSSDALVVYLATAALMSLMPSQSARSILSAFTEQKASLQFSSLVGPSAAVLVGGCPLKSVYSLLPAQSGLSMAVSVLTYADQVFVAVATDSSLEPAGTMILSHLQAQVELMYTLLKNRRVPGEAKSDTMLYRFPDVTRSPVRELASRLPLVQGEVERLSRSHSDATTHETERLHRLRAEFTHLLRELRKRKSLSLASRLSLVQGEVERLSRSHSDATTHETERLHRLRAEFTHLLRELRKRKSLSEMEPWDVQWRSRRRAMSCSFSRRPSMSVVSLLSTARPASVIETSNHVVSPVPHHLPRHTPPAPPLHSTLAFTDSDGPSTSHTSVFNVNYQSDSSTPSLSSPPSAPKYYQRLSEYSDSGQVCGGLYDEILRALESSETLYDMDRRRWNGTAFRDHIESNFAHAEIRCKSRSNLRKYKSRTMNSVYDKSLSHRWRRPELGEVAGRKPRMSRSCNHLNGRLLQNSDYEVAIESLSDFATKIRRLSLENTLVDKPHRNVGYSWDVGNSFYQQRKVVDRSRRHSTIPKQQCEECTVSLHHSIYEFV